MVFPPVFICNGYIVWFRSSPHKHIASLHTEDVYKPIYGLFSFLKYLSAFPVLLFLCDFPLTLIMVLLIPTIKDFIYHDYMYDFALPLINSVLPHDRTELNFFSNEKFQGKRRVSKRKVYSLLITMYFEDK